MQEWKKGRKLLLQFDDGREMNEQERKTVKKVLCNCASRKKYALHFATKRERERKVRNMFVIRRKSDCHVQNPECRNIRKQQFLVAQKRDIKLNSVCWRLAVVCIDCGLVVFIYITHSDNKCANISCAYFFCVWRGCGWWWRVLVRSAFVIYIFFYFWLLLRGMCSKKVDYYIAHNSIYCEYFSAPQPEALCGFSFWIQRKLYSRLPHIQSKSNISHGSSSMLPAQPEPKY